MIGFINRLLASRLFQFWMNQNAIARLLGKLADSRCLPKFILKKIIKAYIKNFNINMSEYECDLERVACFNDFFTRQLKVNSRPIQKGVISPVDGVVTHHGLLHRSKKGASQLFQVKGKAYSLEALVAEKPMFSQGCYVTLYLSPADYHRFHAPIDLTLLKLHYVPGDLLTTNPQALLFEDNIYCRNERMVLSASCSFGNLYLVAVGATAVGRISLNFSDLKTNIKFQQEAIITEGLPVDIKKGQELGFFELGSTVVLILETNTLTDFNLEVGRMLKMGETLWT